MANSIEGYILTKNKKAIQKFGNNETLLSFEEANKNNEFAGKIKVGFTVIDVDNADEAERLKKVVEAMGLNCMIIRTPRGMHFFLGSSPFIQKNITGAINALGVRFDAKVGGRNSYAVLKQDGILRERKVQTGQNTASCERTREAVFSRIIAYLLVDIIASAVSIFFAELKDLAQYQRIRCNIYTGQLNV